MGDKEDSLGRALYREKRLRCWFLVAAEAVFWIGVAGLALLFWWVG